MDIGVRIKDLRVNVYKENSRDFAKRCGISKSGLLQIERGEIIKPTRKVLNKIEKALDIDLKGMSITNGKYVYTRNQKKTRFKNVLGAICVDLKRNVSCLQSLTNETLYLRDDKYLDQQIDEIISELENVSKAIKQTDIETKEEKVYKVIDNMFNNKMEMFPPRKKEVI